MTAFYIVLKISALLLVILLPLFVPQRKKKESLTGISNLAVNEHGYLEKVAEGFTDHHPIQ
jgi:hypothetical protein